MTLNMTSPCQKTKSKIYLQYWQSNRYNFPLAHMLVRKLMHTISLLVWLSCLNISVVEKLFPSNEVHQCSSLDLLFFGSSEQPVKVLHTSVGPNSIRVFYFILFYEPPRSCPPFATPNPLYPCAVGSETSILNLQKT